MRGTNLTLNQPYRGKYYAPIATTANNHTTYTYDTQPQVFRFQDRVTEVSSLTQNIKGLTSSTTFLGNVFKISNRRWRIATTNQYIDFKENGKVVVNVNGEDTLFIITKVTEKTGALASLASFRNGSVNSKALTKILDLS